MNADLTQLARELDCALSPEQVFGGSHLPRDQQAAAVRGAYRRLARRAHPDAYRAPEEQILAARAFQRLAEWLARAEALLAAQAYGEPQGASPQVILKSPRREYRVDTRYQIDGPYNTYACRFGTFGRVHTALLKIVRDPRDNGLALRESRTLGHMRRSRWGASFVAYLPGLLEAFSYQAEGRTHRALVLAAEPGWYSLETVRQAFPDGVDPKDMAWIWRRLLVIIGYAHNMGVLHRAVLSQNVWIHPEQHGLQLRGWTRAALPALDGLAPLNQIDPATMDRYSPGAYSPPTPGMDVAMSAKTMIYILGGDPHTHSLPNQVPARLQAFLRGSVLPGRRAPQDAWALKEEFDALLESLWGPRKFHPFQIPTLFKPEEVTHG